MTDENATRATGAGLNEAADRKTAERGTKSSEHPYTVLVVDDDASTRRGLELLLRGESFHVAVAVDGFSALDLATRSPPDVVVTEMNMPGIERPRAPPSAARTRSKTSRRGA